jgi:hypothetical protein
MVEALEPPRSSRPLLALALGLAVGFAEPVVGQEVRAGVLACDVSAGTGLILGSQNSVSCSFLLEGTGRREDYDGSITKYGLDLGLTGGGRMVRIPGSRRPRFQDDAAHHSEMISPTVPK